MHPECKISVFMPNYNNGHYIGKALTALLDQQNQLHEIIIVDDASTDNSLEVIRQFMSQSSLIKLEVNETNLGVIETSRKLLAMVTGTHVYGAGSDDFVLPDFIEKARILATQYPMAGIIFGQMAIVDHDDCCISIEGVPQWQQSGYVAPIAFLNEYLKTAPPNHSLCAATIYRRDAFEEVGYFRNELGPWCDTFAARAIALRYGACYIPEPLMCWRYLENSYSNSTAKTAEKYAGIIDNAVALMRSAEFCDRFPEEYVQAWSQCYRGFLIELHSSNRLKSLNQFKDTVNEYLTRRQKGP